MSKTQRGRDWEARLSDPWSGNDRSVSGTPDDRRSRKDDRAEKRIREMERNAPPPTVTRRSE